MVMIRLMQPILFWKDIIFVTRKILIIEYKNALKCCPAAMLPNLLCTCSTEYRLYNVLVWSEKMNTMQFFPNEMKNKISIVIPFLYILKIILKPFCILFFFLVRIIMGPDRPILPIDDVVMFLLLKETGACCSVIQL